MAAIVGYCESPQLVRSHGGCRPRCWSRPARNTATCSRRAEYVGLAAELARTYLLLGRDPTPSEFIDDILPTAERLDLTRETIELLITRGPALANIGRLRESIVTLVGAVAASKSYGLVDVAAARARQPQLCGRRRGPTARISRRPRRRRAACAAWASVAGRTCSATPPRSRSGSANGTGC